MANNLNIPERTMAQVVDSTNSINVIGGVDGRQSVYEPLAVRITDHVRDTTAETDDPDKMAIFVSQRHGEPFKAYDGLVHKISDADASMTDATVIFPDFDYTKFE